LDVPVSDAPVRVAVIGVGHLGKHHARLLAGIAGAKLVAVADTQADRAAAAAEATGARAVTDSRELLGAVDAVTVAVPTELHREVAMPFLERGISVLVEKPMTRTLDRRAISSRRQRPRVPRSRSAIPNVTIPRSLS
jgi:predicted dehydrogenase